MKAIALNVLVIGIIVFLAGCDDEETIVGCRMKDHVFEETLDTGTLPTANDTVWVFLAAGQDRELQAPVSFTTYSAGYLTDSMFLELHVYGQSFDDIPDPYTTMTWMGDSLYVYYSGMVMHPSFFDCPSAAAKSEPCQPPWYRVDFAIIRHPEGITIVADDTPVGPHDMCILSKEH